MAKEQPFRSIEMRGRQSSVRSDLQAADHTKQLAEFNRREMQKLQTSHEARSAAQRFQNFNTQVLNETAIQQQRFEAANLSTNAQLSARSNEILGRQRLQGERMRIEQEDQIRKMRNSQEIIRNQLQQTLSQQQANSISEFGNQLLNFSQTLYKQKADQINEANKRLQAQGQLDGMLQRYGAPNTELDEAQSSRVATGMRIDNEARQLDSQGLPNDATNLRSHNGFYQYGVQEGIAIKNALELKGYLQNAKEEAIAAGVLQFGDQNADQKLQLFIQQKTIDFMVERGLTSLSPEIQNKYLAKSLITAQLEINAEFNEANREFTLESSIGLARNQIRTAAKKADTFGADLPNMLNQLFAKDPEDFAKNLGKVFDDLKADATESRDMSGLDTLITTILADPRLTNFGQDVLSDYYEFEEEFDKDNAEAANKTAKDLAATLKARFQVDVNSGGLRNASDLAKARAFYTEQANQLPDKHKGPLLEYINGYQVSDIKSIENSNDVFLSEAPSPTEARERVDQYPDMPEPFKKELLNYADNLEEAIEKNPSFQQDIQQALASIELTRPALKQSQLQRFPQIKIQIDEAVKRRQEKLKQRIYKWATDGQGDKEGRDLQDFLKQDAQQQLMNSPINYEQKRSRSGVLTISVPELSLDLGDYDQGVQFTQDDEFPSGLVKQSIDYTDGKRAVFFTSDDLRARARNGEFGLLDSRTGVFLTRPELMAMGQAYEATGAVDSLLRDLAHQARVTPRRFLNDQGALMGMQGTIEEPKEISISTNPSTGYVSRSAAESFAQNKGLSRRGAIWFAHVMMSESAGNPRETHDDDTGYGLFAHRLTRRDDLFAFADSRGKDKSDPVTQMEFALYELETKYPSIFNLITSPNPSTPQLQAAQYDWMRYASIHKAYRAQTLKDQLNRN